MMLQKLPPVPFDRGQRLRSWLGRLSCTRISTRLLLIIGFCLVPTIGLQVAVSWVEWAERKAQVNDLAMHQVQLLAADTASISEGMRLLLATAAEFHQVRTVGKECALRLTSIRRNAPSLAFIVLLDAHGQILCASDPHVEATAPDTGWLHSTLSVTTFTAGRFGRSAEHPGGFLPYYLPLGTTEAGGGGWLVGALDLDWLREHFSQLKQPELGVSGRSRPFSHGCRRRGARPQSRTRQVRWASVAARGYVHRACSTSRSDQDQNH